MTKLIDGEKLLRFLENFKKPAKASDPTRKLLSPISIETLSLIMNQCTVDMKSPAQIEKDPDLNPFIKADFVNLLLCILNKPQSSWSEKLFEKVKMVKSHD